MFIKKFRFRETEARGLSDFLGQCLQWEPKDRPSAAKLLDHYWLKMIPNYNTQMDPDEFREYKDIHKMASPPRKSSNVDELSEGGISDNEMPKKAPKARREERPKKVDDEEEEEEKKA